MNRRSFLSSCLALAAAPAIVRADSLMRIVPRDRLVLKPAVYDCSGNGNHLYRPGEEVLIFATAHTAHERDVIFAYLEGRINADPIRAMNPIAWYRA